MTTIACSSVRDDALGRHKRQRRRRRRERTRYSCRWCRDGAAFVRQALEDVQLRRRTEREKRGRGPRTEVAGGSRAAAAAAARLTIRHGCWEEDVGGGERAAGRQRHVHGPPTGGPAASNCSQMRAEALAFIARATGDERAEILRRRRRWILVAWARARARGRGRDGDMARGRGLRTGLPGHAGEVSARAGGWRRGANSRPVGNR